MNKEFNSKIFNKIINIINEKNSISNSLNLCELKNTHLHYNDKFFYSSGQILFLFYIFNINCLYGKNIENLILQDTRSDSIAKNYIANSIYTINYLPKEIDNINDSQLTLIKKGFSVAYNSILSEKTTVIEFIENNDTLENNLKLITNVRALNYNDLNIQLQLIDIRYKNIYVNILFQDLQNLKDLNIDKIIDLCCPYAEILIQNSLLGIYNNSMERTWIGFINKEIKPIGYYNIYISLFLSYLGKISSKDYYINVAKEAIKPAIRDISYNISYIKDINNINATFYIVNNIIKSKYLNDYINSNMVSNLYFKKELDNIINNNTLLRNYIFSSSINILNKIILPIEKK